MYSTERDTEIICRWALNSFAANEAEHLVAVPLSREGEPITQSHERLITTANTDGFEKVVG